MIHALLRYPSSTFDVGRRVQSMIGFLVGAYCVTQYSLPKMKGGCGTVTDICSLMFENYIICPMSRLFIFNFGC